MGNFRFRSFLTAIAVGILIMLVSYQARAAVKDSADTVTYNVRTWTTSGGGGTISAGIYTIATSIGDPAAGNPISAGAYSLQGGFSAAASTPAELFIYAPLLLR